MTERWTYKLYNKKSKVGDMLSVYLFVFNEAYPKNRKSAYCVSIPTGIKCKPEEWIQGGYLGPFFTGDGHEFRNNKIKDMMATLDGLYHKVRNMAKREPYVSEVIEVYKNGFQEKLRKKLLEYFSEYCDANNLAEETRSTYMINVMGALKNYLKLKYNAEDIFLDEIDKPFIYRFEMYMDKANGMRGKPYSKGTARLYVEKLKAVITFAFKTGEIQSDISSQHEYTIINGKDTRNLASTLSEAISWKISPEDLFKIETLAVSGHAVRGVAEEINNQYSYDLVRVRLLFLLQTWTGFSYSDLVVMKNVRNFIVTDLTEKKSLVYNRAKSGELAALPLFDQAEKILEALNYDATPQCSYDTYNRKIKALLRFYVIEVNEEHSKGTHLPRHLFGTRMLSLGFDMESISRMMGHTSIKITERVYARIDLTSINANYERIKLTTQELGNRIAI